MSSLYEITSDMMTLQAMLLDAPDDECLIDTLESVEFDFERKTDGYCKVIKNIQADVKALSDEIAVLQEKKRVAENAIDRLKNSLQLAMSNTGKDKVKGSLLTLSMRNNAPQLPKDLAPELIPERYYIPQEPKVDRRSLLKDVKEGKVEGIESVRSQSLQIK